MIGRVLLTLDAVGLLLGAPIADFTDSHQFNPRWPAHAKYIRLLHPNPFRPCPPHHPHFHTSTNTSLRFHNAQTITLSIILGLLTLYFTWRRTLDRKDSIRTATICGSIYWLAGLCSQAFPGADGLDVEFGGPGFPQLKIFSFFWGLGVAGWVCENVLEI
jgi:hypothetical protein